MLINKKGNLVTGNFKIFCHQVNCKGVMGAGLAKQIRNEYPEVYNEYKFHCKSGLVKLGSNLYVHTSDDRICVNMFAQDGFDRYKRYTDYSAFKTCLDNLIHFVASRHISEDAVIAFPYGIGCGLVGGDWYVILGMIKDFSEKVPQNVVIVSLR